MTLHTHGPKKYPTSVLALSSAPPVSTGRSSASAHPQRQKDLKYPKSTELLRSSNELGWSLIAELRSHSRYEGPGAAPPANAEVGIIVRGSDEAPVMCKVDGSWQHARLTTGSIWLRPVGGKSDEARIGSATVEALHLYVPTVAFARLMDDYNLPAVPGRFIRYSCGLQDELINQIGLSVLSEMMSPTAGRMLVETSSLMLARGWRTRTPRRSSFGY